MRTHLSFPIGLLLWSLAAPLLGAEPEIVFHVSPNGNDAASGAPATPFATLARAQAAARTFAGVRPVTVTLHGGVFYLPETLVFGPEDSGSAEAPIRYVAAPGTAPVISGGQRLALDWKPFRDGIWRAEPPRGLALDQLFLNGERLPMARYPNYDPQVRHFNGFAPDAIAPERVVRWANPAGGYIHAMHNALWGDMHWRILGKKPDGSLDFEGGWQNNRPSPMHREFRFVENIFEELDTPGEWFHDAAAGLLYLFPPWESSCQRPWWKSCASATSSSSGAPANAPSGGSRSGV